MNDSGLAVIANKPPIVATHVGSFGATYADTVLRYKQEAATYVQSTELQQYQQKLLDLILTPKTSIGCLVAPFGYGKTSTTIGIWRAAQDAGLLAIPPFSCNSVAEMGQAIATGIELAIYQTHPEAAASVKSAYHTYLVSSTQRLAEQDAYQYDIPQDTALRIIQDKVERGLLNLEASGIHLLRFLEQLVEIVIEAQFCGLLIIVDEFQQFLGSINKAVITNFRTLIWGLKTRQALPLGFLLTMDPDTESNLSDRAGDILHRIKEDGLYLNFASIYNREFPRLLWNRYANVFDFDSKSQIIVDRATLEAIGQICERADLSNGPRTVINAFQRIANLYPSRQKPYTVFDLIDDFLTGALKFDGDRNKIASLVTELTGYDYIKRVPSGVNTLKLIAAFPRGCPREVAEQYGLADTFDQFTDELRGEILTQLPEGSALIDLQRVGKPQNKLNIILKKYWMQITELEIISDHILTLFGRYAIEPLFPAYGNVLSGWRREENNFILSPNGGYWQIYEGAFSREYPSRRICVQICRQEDQAIDPSGVTTKEWDLNLIFILHQTSEQKKHAVHHQEQHTLILHIPIYQPFGLPLARDIRWIEDYLSPVVMTPGILLSLIDYIQRQFSTIEGITEPESQRISGTQAKLQSFLLTMLFDEILFNSLGTKVIARGAQAIPEALFTLFRNYYPNYHTLVTIPQWENLLDSYTTVLKTLSLLQRRGIESVSDSKTNLAARFGQHNHAGFQSQAKQFNQLFIIANWTGNTGEIRFLQHPGEFYLLNIITRTGVMSRELILTEGHKAGYTFKESEYLLEFLEQRGYLEYNKESNNYQPINNLSQAELDDLSQVVKRELDLLEKVLADDKSLASVRADIYHIINRLQHEENQFDELQVRLLQQQRQLHQSREQLAHFIRTQLESVHRQVHKMIDQLKQALPLLPTDWILASHLNGVQRTISDEHKPIIKRLASQAHKLAEFLKQPLNLAEANLDRLEVLITNYQTLLNNTQQTIEQANTMANRVQFYLHWVQLVAEMRRVQEYLEVAAKIVDTAPLRQSLAEIVSQAREGFATIGLKGLNEMYGAYAPPIEKLLNELSTAVSLAKMSVGPSSSDQAEARPAVIGASLPNGTHKVLQILKRTPTVSISELLTLTGDSPDQLINDLIALEKTQAIISQISAKNGSTQHDGQS